MPHVRNVGGHETAHAPPAHVSPAAHATPHAPQFAASVIVLTHDDPQPVCPTGHESSQAPAEQTSPAAHA